MPLTRRAVLGTAGAAAMPVLRSARAQSSSNQSASIRIGVLGDESGVYRELSGPIAIAAVKLAIADSKAAGRDIEVEVITGDHQNKPDIGAGLARQWIDRDHVDMIIDVPNSAVALAVAGVCKEMDKAYINSPGATADLTGPQCAPTTVHWTMDTWMLAHSTGAAMVKAGGDSWYFITADYAFGKDLAGNCAAAVQAAGGVVLGEARHPLGTADFSSFLLQAQASGAGVIGLANAGGDLYTAMKQAHEFGLTEKQKLACFVCNITGMPGLGLDIAQGSNVATPFYWDFNDATRMFSKRYLGKHPKKLMPNDMQAGMYAATAHLLKSYAQAKTAEGKALVDAMKAMPTDDPLFGKGSIRADGRHIHPVYLMQVKTPAESKGAWDVFKTVATIAPADAWRPLDKGGCPFVKA